MTSVALYQLAGQYQQLLSSLSELDLDAGCVADTLEASGLVDDITDKAVGIEMVARSLEMSVPAIDKELIRLESLKARQILKAQGLRHYLLTNMQATGITKIEAPLFKISLQNNPPSIDVYELGLIPSEYMRQPDTPPPAPDKKAIAAALKAGIEVQGAKLVQSQRLVIK
jgi:hypothetical protein